LPTSLKKLLLNATTLHKNGGILQRHLSLLLITLLVTALSACGNRTEPPEPKAIPTVTGLPAEPKTKTPKEDAESYPAPEEGEGEAPTETGEADRNVAPAEAYPAVRSPRLALPVLP